jgi:uncharacterized protein
VTLLGPVLIASLLGSLHCVGMCGGLVSFYSGSGSAKKGASGRDTAAVGARWVVHAAYHLTRLIAYLILGASAGQLGVVLDLAGGRVGLADLGAWCAGLVILFWAVFAVSAPVRRARLLRLRRRPAGPPSALQRLESYFATLAHRARERPPLWRASALGLSSALLPCGWLYGFVVLAAGTGSWSRGALLLGAFWSGTVPALLGLGLGVERLSQPLRAYVPRLSALLLIGVATFNIVTRWPLTRSAEGAASAVAAPSCHAQH